MSLEVQDLAKVYADKKGLLPTRFKVDHRELLAVVGHNGAGKSTLLKLLGGWLVPDQGRMLLDGIDQNNRSAMVRKIGFVPETPNLFDAFSVEYNLRLFARLFETPFSRVEEILNTFKLLPFRHNPVHVLSRGLKQRVSIGRALLPDPPILLLDEPTAGLDFEMTKEIYKLLKHIHELGKTILFTSHRPEEIKTLATRILVLHQGSVVYDGLPQAYFQSSIYADLYL
jgi:ABC-2 type transport system ATP-binding protein